MDAINALTLNQSSDSDSCVDRRKADAIGVIALIPHLTRAQKRSLERDENTSYATARSALRVAQRERDTHKAARDRIQDAVTRANDLSSAIEKRLVRFTKLDRRIAEAFAESLLRASEQETLGAFELSPKMKRLAETKFALESQLAAIRRALDCLGQDLAEAESDLKRSEQEVEKAAISVLATEMEPIATELARVESLAAGLRRLLLGYGALRHEGGFLPMSCMTAQLLRAPPKNAMVGGSAHCSEATGQWAAHLQQLSIDCEATFDSGATAFVSLSQE